MAADRTFGPTAVLTPANAVTVLRILATVGVVALIFAEYRWAAFVLFIVVALSDNVDGWLARRQGTTRSGAFLDPLADKVMVGGILVALALKGDVSWLPVVLILGREVAMSAFRSYAAGKGVSVPASNWGKAKTFSTNLAIAALLVPMDGLQTLGTVLLWVAVVLTWVSFAHYAMNGRALMEKGRTVDAR